MRQWDFGSIAALASLVIFHFLIVKMFSLFQTFKSTIYAFCVNVMCILSRMKINFFNFPVNLSLALFIVYAFHQDVSSIGIYIFTIIKTDKNTKGTKHKLTTSNQITKPALQGCRVKIKK